MTTAPRSPPSSGSFAAIAAARSRSTLKVPIRFTRTTVSNGWSAAGPSLPTVRSAQPMPGARHGEAQLAGALDRGLDLRLVRHVRLRERAADLLRQRRAALLVQVRDGHARAARGELAGGRLAQARGAAGDQGPYVRQAATTR